MSYVLALAGFMALIVLHEAGHFVVAKAVGMRVERFFLFFPPKVVSIKRGETEYGIGAIPLGGFVKITGMNPDEELPPEVARRGYYRQPVWKRIAVISAGPAVNIAIAFAILFVLALNVQEPTSEVARIAPGTPAQGKLEKGDRIISVDGVKGGQEKLAEQIDSHHCPGQPIDGCRAAEPATVVLKRNGRTMRLRITPMYDRTVRRNRIGFAFGTRDGQASVGEAISLSTGFMWEVTEKTASVFAHLFEAKERKQLSGVAGSYEATRQAIDVGTRQALTLIALISLSLGLINLLPFLPLDGGHIFWSLVEKLRGRPISFMVMERAGMIGFVLVIGLFLLGLSNDVDRLTGSGINVR